jgi:ATP-dependent RNA helicase SUPV3L1/SUV3
VCGDHSCIALTQKLCELTGKEFQQHSYERLTPLTVDMEGLGPEGYAGLKPGDCVVAFSKRDLYNIRQQIVKATGAPLPFIWAQ